MKAALDPADTEFIQHSRRNDRAPLGGIDVREIGRRTVISGWPEPGLYGTVSFPAHRERQLVVFGELVVHARVQLFPVIVVADAVASVQAINTAVPANTGDV